MQGRKLFSKLCIALIVALTCTHALASERKGGLVNDESRRLSTDPLLARPYVSRSADGRSFSVSDELVHSGEITQLERASPDQPHEVIFAVKQQNTERLEEILLSVSSPLSPEFGAHWPLEQVRAFTADHSAAETVQRLLKQEGIDIMSSSLNGEYITARARIDKWESLLQTQFFHFTDARRQRQRHTTQHTPPTQHTQHTQSSQSSQSSQPTLSTKKTAESFPLASVVRALKFTLPASLSPHVSSVWNVLEVKDVHALARSPQALESQSTFFPSSEYGNRRHLASSASPYTVTPSLLREQYKIDPSLNGSLSSLSIHSRVTDSSVVSLADVESYLRSYDGDYTAAMSLSGLSSCASSNSTCVRSASTTAAVEVMAAIGRPASLSALSLSVAPSSALSFWQQWLTSISSLSSVEDVIYLDALDLERDISPSIAEAFNVEVMKLGIAGTTVVVSAGDAGASAGQSDCGFNPLFPASSPYVLTVGALQGLRTTNTEKVCQSNTGGEITSGGGISSLFATPSWQESQLNSYFEEYCSLHATTAPSHVPSQMPSLAPVNATNAPSFAPSPSPSSNTPTHIPTCVPTHVPTISPTISPSRAPSLIPTIMPSAAPTEEPTEEPTNTEIVPSLEPSRIPTISPTEEPSENPTQSPTTMQTQSPTVAPTEEPSQEPVMLPTLSPTETPSHPPSMNPTTSPTDEPSEAPTQSPTQTNSPTQLPSQAPTRSPTVAPTYVPSFAPTLSPTPSSSEFPTVDPTVMPTEEPSQELTISPSIAPSYAPSEAPTQGPTQIPSHTPTHTPSQVPTEGPTVAPTEEPSQEPTLSPSQVPTEIPTQSPSNNPTTTPSYAPSEALTDSPTNAPTNSPTHAFTLIPTLTPTQFPTNSPTESPSQPPSISPTFASTSTPTEDPTVAPTEEPSEEPTISPTQSPTEIPSHSPSRNPTTAPSYTPSELPTHSPTQSPTRSPTESPSISPSLSPTDISTSTPSQGPTIAPTQTPTAIPTLINTISPTETPTAAPTEEPTAEPSQEPTEEPFTHVISMFSAFPPTPKLEPTVKINDPTEESIFSLKIAGLSFTTESTTEHPLSQHMEPRRVLLASSPSLSCVPPFPLTGRAYPDVSLLADHFASIVSNNPSTISSGALSAATVAGLLTLLNSARIAQGKPRVGFINPSLYHYASVYVHDITKGNNSCSSTEAKCCDGSDSHVAVPGFDAVSGLGSIDYSAFFSLFLSLPAVSNTTSSPTRFPTHIPTQAPSYTPTLFVPTQSPSLSPTVQWQPLLSFSLSVDVQGLRSLNITEEVQSALLATHSAVLQVPVDTLRFVGWTNISETSSAVSQRVISTVRALASTYSVRFLCVASLALVDFPQYSGNASLLLATLNTRYTESFTTGTFQQSLVQSSASEFFADSAVVTGVIDEVLVVAAPSLAPTLSPFTRSSQKSGDTLSTNALIAMVIVVVAVVAAMCSGAVYYARFRKSATRNNRQQQTKSVSLQYDTLFPKEKERALDIEAQRERERPRNPADKERERERLRARIAERDKEKARERERERERLRARINQQSRIAQEQDTEKEKMKERLRARKLQRQQQKQQQQQQQQQPNQLQMVEHDNISSMELSPTQQSIDMDAEKDLVPLTLSQINLLDVKDEPRTPPRLLNWKQSRDDTPTDRKREKEKAVSPLRSLESQRQRERERELSKKSILEREKEFLGDHWIVAQYDDEVQL